MVGFLVALSAVIGFLVGAILCVCLYGRFAGRVRGRPSFSLPTSPPPTQLDNLIEPLLAKHKGQTGLVLIDDNLDAFAIRVLAARHAGRSLDLLYYMWKRDLTGRLLANEVLKAADRGVRIRLLLDDLNARKHDKTYLVLDTHPNIQVRLFNPTRNRNGAFRRGIELLLRSFSATRRMHNKAWIADGQLSIVGGRNIGDAYFDAGVPTNFRDLDLLMFGTGVRQTADVFDEYWNSGAVLPIVAFEPRCAINLQDLRQVLARVGDSEQARLYLGLVREHGSVRGMLNDDSHVHWTSTARIIADPPEKAMGGHKDTWLVRFIRPLLLSASTDLDIISPYFVPREAGTALLLALSKRGVRIRLLTNSLAATDVIAVHGAYARWRAPLIAGGVRLFELKSYAAHRGASLFGSSIASLHTKAFTVDGHLGFVGSMNFDPRSASLNCEMGIYFKHDRLVEKIKGVFSDQASPEKSYRLCIENGEIRWEDHSGGTVRTGRGEPDASPWRRLAATIVGFLPIESQL